MKTTLFSMVDFMTVAYPIWKLAAGHSLTSEFSNMTFGLVSIGQK